MQPTRDTSTLDLIFTDMVEYYEIPAILAPHSTSDHNVFLKGTWLLKTKKLNL